MAHEAIDNLTASPSFTPPRNTTRADLKTPFLTQFFPLQIDSRNTSSNSGLHGIDYYSINKLPIKYQLILLDIYNEVYLTSDFQNSFVHLIRKQYVNGLRPIKMCKVFEIMLKNRLQWYCENNGIISADQNAFCKGRSCIDNILNLTLCGQDGFRNNCGCFP